ncbi:hypothetical protein H8486_002906 [Listeria monocytogenes]|nr:hypothetical protein [Listeria monocytogenes]EGC1215214.1 hypothetical protein [Listeria monocytogenes]EGX6726901.1 hypothetical protein [Listeria innocua]EGX6739283.1 hypothetical protein [Listeria innocua]
MKQFFDMFLRILENETGKEFYPVVITNESGEEVTTNYVVNAETQVFSFQGSLPKELTKNDGKVTITDNEGNSHNFSVDKIARLSLPPDKLEEYLTKRFREHHGK